MATYAEIRTVIVGAGAVGKSTLTISFYRNLFIDIYEPTIEDSYRKLVTLADATTCLLEVLDVAGEEEYSAIKDQNARTAQGFLVIYSITDANSFDVMMVNIEQILRVKDLDYVPMVIMGNKCDLESGRQVETQAGEKGAAMYNVPFFETSAKFAINVEEAFMTLANEVTRFKTTENNRRNKRGKKKQCVVC